MGGVFTLRRSGGGGEGLSLILVLKSTSVFAWHFADRQISNQSGLFDQSSLKVETDSDHVIVRTSVKIGNENIPQNTLPEIEV